MITKQAQLAAINDLRSLTPTELHSVAGHFFIFQKQDDSHFRRLKYSRELDRDCVHFERNRPFVYSVLIIRADREGLNGKNLFLYSIYADNGDGLEQVFVEGQPLFFADWDARTSYAALRAIEQLPEFKISNFMISDFLGKERWINWEQDRATILGKNHK